MRQCRLHPLSFELSDSPNRMPSIPPRRATRAQGNRTSWLRWLLASAMAALAACKSPPPQAPTAQDSKMPSRDTAAGPAATPAPKASAAATPRDYRKDAASHLYSHNQHRIYKGKLPPMLYAIGVLEVDIDRQGRVARLHWTRAPRHAPEVVAEIERTVRAAAPYPTPSRLGKVTYTDTWLWDKSGNFQLDTLTEGQL